MANIINLAAIGVKVGYAVEETAGSRPTEFTHLHNIKNTPSLNPAPETIESTTFDNVEFKSYVEGLKDLGGALELTANLTQNLLDEWDTMMTAYEAAIASNKQTWFVISIPGLKDAVFFTGKPSALGLPELAYNSLAETSVYITPLNEPAWYTQPTFKDEAE